MIHMQKCIHCTFVSRFVSSHIRQRNHKLFLQRVLPFTKKSTIRRVNNIDWTKTTCFSHKKLIEYQKTVVRSISIVSKTKNMFFSTKKKTFYSHPKFDQKFIDFAKVFKSMLKQLNMKNLHVFFAWIHRKLARFYDKKNYFLKNSV